MNSMIPLVLSKVVENDLCIGCGACVQACPSKALDVNWNNHGFLVATGNSNLCEADGVCVEVCPFNPEPNSDYKNEDGLAADYLSDTPNQHNKIGRYHSIYAGYSVNHRDTSSSGGIATYVYDELFNLGLIDHVVTVGEASSSGAHYQYSILSRQGDITRNSKTRYHPVTLANVLGEIKSLEGRVAISGVGCFIKAIRLAQNKDPVLKSKIHFLVGIVCGGVKSKFFTDYLASKAGAQVSGYSKPEYRVKDHESTAMDYGFSCTDDVSSSTKLIKMKEVGDMWGSGLFKANACDFCDDVTTELSDISLGDAWLEPYSQDGRGHNVVVSRSAIADKILQKGMANGNLILEPLSKEAFLASQQGSFNHRHDGLSTRIALATNAGAVVPPTRNGKTGLPLYLRLVQRARRKARAESLKVWADCKDAVEFEQRMKWTLLELRLVTRLSHAVRKIKKINGRKA